MSLSRIMRFLWKQKELEKEYYDFKYRIISKFDEEYRKSHE